MGEEILGEFVIIGPTGVIRQKFLQMAYEYQEYPKYLYHPKFAPTGKVFQSADETKGLYRKGWVDTPAKFPKASRPRRAIAASKTWWTEWEWAFKAVGVILGIAGAIVGVVIALKGFIDAS